MHDDDFGDRSCVYIQIIVKDLEWGKEQRYLTERHVVESIIRISYEADAKCVEVMIQEQEH